jgi:hypothetical protein
MATISNKKFQITLDRDPPTYYAGEIVTGTLAVKPDQNEKCRFLQVEMHGEARVHWSSTNTDCCTFSFWFGDDGQEDHTGRKQYLLIQRTLWGNFYRTAILYGAGGSAEFGNAVGDGTMYIPCLPNEGEHGGGAMRLIVRVCRGRIDIDYYIVIDARKLASANDSVTYKLLTRTDIPEQGTIALAGRFVPTSANAGSTGMSPVVSSELFILTVLKVDNLRNGAFGKSDVYVQASRAPPNDLSCPQRIPGQNSSDPSKITVLPNGRTEYKFAFQTRADSPGSASFGINSRIAYYVYAKIDKKWRINPSIKIPITIEPSRPVPLPPLLAPFQKESKELPLYKIKFFFISCGEAGTAKIKVKLGRRAYAPGEPIDLFCDLSNNSTLSVDLKVVLKQHILMTESSRHAISQRMERDFFLFKKHCEAQSSLFVGHRHGPIETIRVPAFLPPSFFGARGLAAAGGRSIDPLTFTYHLEVEAKADSGSKINVKIPILISALPPTSDAVLAASGEIPVPVYKAFGVKEFTITDDSPCETVKSHPGKKDGGARDIVPSVTNIWSMRYSLQCRLSMIHY